MIVSFYAIQEYFTQSGIRTKVKLPMIQLVCFVVGFLFAQAIIFEATVPLFVPFYIACTIYDQKFRRAILLGGLLGSLTLGVGHCVLLIVQIILFNGLKRITFFENRSLVTLFLATAITQIVWQLIFYAFHVPLIVQLYVGYEVLTTIIMYIFFKQAFVAPNKLFVDWRYERVISVMIVFAMILVAVNDIQIFNVALAPLLLQFVICCAAFYGDMALATFVATVVSVTFSMSQLSFSGMIALYAITGALVGNAKKLGKYGIAALSIVPSIVFVFYDATLPLDSVHFTSISLGALLFLQVATVVRIREPIEQQESDVPEQALDDFRRFNIFLQEMVDVSLSDARLQTLQLTDFNICQSCYRYEQCWAQGQMENKLKAVVNAQQSASYSAQIKAEQALQEACIRPVHLNNELQHRLQQFNIMRQQYYSRKLIGQELKNMGSHFERLLQHTAQTDTATKALEQQLLQRLKEFHCVDVTIEKRRFGYVLGNFHLVESVDERQLVKALTVFFNEQIEIFEQKDVQSVIPSTKYRFRTAIRYQIEYDIYNKTNAQISGDHVVVTEVERGLHAILVADGMGTGAVAREQSKQLLFLLRQCMQYQLTPELTLTTLQYLLNPLTLDSYATLDLLLLDVKKGELIAWKSGSTATYVVRGDKLIVLESRTAPIGTLEQQVNAQKVQLLAGDFVFVLTDGMFESSEYEQQERYLQQLLLQNARYDWSLSTLLYEVMEAYKARYEVRDDVTLIATKIEHLQENWATVKLEVK